MPWFLECKFSALDMWLYSYACWLFWSGSWGVGLAIMIFGALLSISLDRYFTSRKG